MPELAHKKACNDCPFRRKSMPGWLGAEEDPMAFVDGALADFALEDLPCHMTIDYSEPDWKKNQYPFSLLCAGALIFCKNNMKLPRDRERSAHVQAVEADHEEVFSTPDEFIAHHARKRGQS